MDMPENKWFYFKHGRRASNIEELKTALENIDEPEFKHHVNNEKNDFATWVEDVFGEEKLASNMREVGDKEGIIILLDDFLAQKNEPPSPPLNIPEEHPKRQRKRVIIPEEKKLSLEPEKDFSENEPSEKELSEKEIKNLVDEAMLVFDRSEAEKPEKEEEKDEQETEVEEKPGEIEEVEEAEERKEIDTAEEEWIPKHKPKLEIEKPMLEKEPHKFMVEEFLYGFIMGLIFGLIMLGIILQLKVT